MTGHLIKGASPTYRQPPATVSPAIDGGGSPVVVAQHLIAGRSGIFRQRGLAPGPEIPGTGSPIVIGPHLIAGRGQIYRQPGNRCAETAEWDFGLFSDLFPGLAYYGGYRPDPIAPYIFVLASDVSNYIYVQTFLPGNLTYPFTLTLTVTDTDITMTVLGHSVIGSYADGVPSPVAPPDFTTPHLTYAVLPTGAHPHCTAFYEDIIGNGTNFGGGGPESFATPGPWTDPFVGQVTFPPPEPY
jgi:hypothetical protein